MVRANEMETEHELSSVSDEELKVRCWRRRCLLEMGLTLIDANLLADSDADLHDMVAHLRNGCPVETLRRLVL